MALAAFVRLCNPPNPSFMPALDSVVSREITTLYSDHHSWLQAWLRRKLGNAFDAADLAQDAYLRLMGRDVQEIRTLREPRAMLVTIAQGLAANLYRRRAIEQAYLDTLALQPQPTAISPEQRAIVLEALVEIDRLLGELPLPVRQAFLLSQIEVMKQADIAVELGVSLPTARRYIARAVVQVCFLNDAPA